jgi:Redoxin
VKRSLITLAVLVALGGTIGLVTYAVTRGESTPQPHPPGIPVGAVAPPFSLAARQEIVTPKSFTGRSVVLAFITPTCHACAADLRRVGALAPKLIGAAGSKTSYLVVDRGRPPGEIVEFAKSVGIQIGPYLTSDRTGAVWRAYRVGTPGTVFVISANGRVAWRGIDPSLSTLRAHVHDAASLVTLPS